MERTYVRALTHISLVVQVKGLLFNRRQVPLSYYLVFDEQKVRR
jgi:hypothetical protein